MEDCQERQCFKCHYWHKNPVEKLGACGKFGIDTKPGFSCSPSEDLKVRIGILRKSDERGKVYIIRAKKMKIGEM